MKNILIAAFPALLLVLAAGNLAGAEAKTLDTLAIEGLVVVKPDNVSDAVLLRAGSEFTPADVQESIRRLYKLGHFRKIDFIIGAETDSSVSLTLSLEEFPLVDAVEFFGNKKIKKKELEEKKLHRHYNAPMSDAQLHKSRQAILDLYADKGYLLAKVDAEVINTSVPGNAIVKYTIDEGPRVKVKTIVFKGAGDAKAGWLARLTRRKDAGGGASEVTRGWLMRRFKTKENRWWRSGDFNYDLYRAHLDTLVMHYNDKGFLDAAIERDTVWYSEDKRDIFIEITVNEGRKYYAGDVAFVGNNIIESDALLPKVALAKGKPFRKSQFEMTKYLVETAYREEGYLWVRVDDKRSYKRGEEADTVDLVFEIAEGRPAIVRKIDVRGNSKTWEKVIRREISLIPGQRYRQSLMAASQQNIMRQNFFQSALPDIVPNDDGTVDVVFDIVEKDNIGQLTVGAAYSDQDKLTGTFSTAIPNFRGSGQELKLEVQYGYYRKLGMISFTEPWAFDTPLWLTGTIFADQQVYSYYSGNSNDTTTSYGFRVGAGRSRLTWPDNKFRFQTVYQLSHEKTSRPDINLSGMSIVETGIMSKLRFNIERYDLDMPLFPNEGSRLTIAPEIAGLGGDFKYLKGTVSYENYFRLPGKLVFGSDVKFGAITKLFDTLAISGDNLFTGGGAYGDAIIRGYPDWAFGGYRYRNEGNGISMFSVNMSLRYPIIDQQIYVGLFADMGNTWTTIAGIDLGDLYRGVGGGLRINLPMIGVMGVDVGYGLDPLDKSVIDNKPHGVNWHIIMNKGF
ncbi:MAG: BamA/TamA family outer membrane protein [Chitinispirillales bacterium]|jgi:outer membrane protein insertion porin family|nr:BamA/TamA family outer membrane protein [Chitinispirillales bacterium]